MFRNPQNLLKIIEWCVLVGWIQFWGFLTTTIEIKKLRLYNSFIAVVVVTFPAIVLPGTIDWKSIDFKEQ